MSFTSFFMNETSNIVYEEFQQLFDVISVIVFGF